ncbi:MAG: hypothetical protein AB7F86_06980 [Bdellovibrionales bacterium]
MRHLLGALIVSLFISPRAEAVTPIFDINAFYLSDTFTYSSASSVYNRTFYDLMAGFGMTKKGSFVLGWAYSSMSFSDNPGTETKLTITDMGPKIAYYFDKDREWVIGFTYNLITKGTYSSGGSSTEMRGSSMRAELGYVPMMWESVLIGAKLIYYQASFSEEVVNQTTLNGVSNSRKVIYPSLSVTFRWD